MGFVYIHVQLIGMINKGHKTKGISNLKKLIEQRFDHYVFVLHNC